MTWASLGPSEGSYLFLFTRRLEGGNRPWFVWGNLPRALLEWLVDGNGDIKRDSIHTRVVLGPNDSFFAWDPTSVRW